MVDADFFVANPELEGAEKALVEQHKVQREQQAAQHRIQQTQHSANRKQQQAQQAQASVTGVNTEKKSTGNDADKVREAMNSLAGKTEEEKAKLQQESREVQKKKDREREIWMEKEKEIARRLKLERDRKAYCVTRKVSSTIATDKLRSKSGKINSCVQIHEDIVVNTQQYNYQEYETPRGEILMRCLQLGAERRQGSRVWHRYWKGLREFISHRLSKREFDELLLDSLYLPADVIELHNRFIMQVCA